MKLANLINNPMGLTNPLGVGVNFKYHNYGDPLYTPVGKHIILGEHLGPELEYIPAVSYGESSNIVNYYPTTVKCKIDASALPEGVTAYFDASQDSNIESISEDGLEANVYMTAFLVKHNGLVYNISPALKINFSGLRNCPIIYFTINGFSEDVILMENDYTLVLSDFSLGGENILKITNIEDRYCTE